MFVCVCVWSPDPYSYTHTHSAHTLAPSNEINNNLIKFASLMHFACNFVVAFFRHFFWRGAANLFSVEHSLALCLSLCQLNQHCFDPVLVSLSLLLLLAFSFYAALSRVVRCILQHANLIKFCTYRRTPRPKLTLGLCIPCRRVYTFYGWLYYINWKRSADIAIFTRVSILQFSPFAACVVSSHTLPWGIHVYSRLCSIIEISA